MATIVVGALRRPRLATGTIEAPNPASIGDTLVGPAQYTVDGTSSEQWTFFDFSSNSVVVAPGPLDWDLAVRRFHIIANGGPGFRGQGAIADLGVVVPDSVRVVPDSGWQANAADSTNPAIRRWYDYGYTSHLLQPNGHSWAVRTADGKYAVVTVASYYCDQVQAGCMTLRYVYQGDGSRTMRR